MIYDPLIDELAALPLNLLVTPADQQTEEGQTACWCPFCKGNAGSTPHFIIYNRKRGGLYGKPVEHWFCTKTKRGGYGAIELYAAMKGLGYWWRKDSHSAQTFICVGEDLRQACLQLAMLAGHTKEEVGEKWPQLLKRDYRETAIRPQERVTFEPKTGFTPQDLAALGCTTWLDYDGVEHYGFETGNKDAGWHFDPADIQRDFKISAVGKVTLPAVSRKGEPVSEVLVSTPWNPIFVALVDDETEDSGSIFFPALGIPPMVFCNTDEHTSAKVSRWLAGDKVFVRALELKTSENTGVRKAIQELDPEERVTEVKQEWQESSDKNGNVKMELVDVPLRDKDIKAKAIIYCPSAPDAVATYYHMKALRHTYPKQFGSRWYHVCFPYGAVPFSPVHYNKMHRFADNIYTLFPSATKQTLKARDISCRYRDVLRAELPETIGDRAHLYFPRLYCHPVQTVSEFFLAYQMLPREAYQNDEDINRLFSSCITSALSSDPFERKEKRDKNGMVKEVYYTINPATLWEFMASAGYARDVRPDEPDKIGRYVHIDGPFADELEPSSMVQATIEQLKAYARQLNDSRPGMPDEYELMVQAVLRANKEINEKTIASLPSVKLNYADGYGRHVEHFFYDNGALRITENEISMQPYDRIDFNVERAELLHWNMTPIKNLPFEISENPEYRTRLEAIKNKREQKDDNGKPLYTLQQLAQDDNDLALWAQSHRWIVDWKGKNENEMWPPLRVIRGFANEEWEQEQRLLHDGKQFSVEEQMELDCRFANLIFCLGRMLWRYRDSKSNCISYLIENVVSAANRAEGGSGKSTFVRVFAGCAAHILNINGRDLVSNKEFSANLAEYQHHKHRVVHWEDVDASLDFGKLYNLTTGDFSVRYMYKDRITIPLSEGPGHVVTSNYPLHDLDDSTMRRVCLGGFSHRFCGQNIMKNKAARYISDIMPDFNAVSPEKLSASSRNQIAMICALAVQFVMRYDEKVDAQKKYMEERTLTQTLTPQFLRFARVFFAQEHVYGVPIDLDSMLEEYKADFAEASKSRDDSFSPKRFKERVLSYCETAGIQMNPPQLFKKADGKVLKKAEQTNYFAHQAWRTRRYFDGREWEDDQTIQPKQIRELTRTEHAVYFYRIGKDQIPANNDELMKQYAVFITQPDPAPITDDNGNIVTLTEEEQARWRSYLDSRQRKRVAGVSAVPTAATATDGSPSAPPQEEDLPF